MAVDTEHRSDWKLLVLLVVGSVAMIVLSFTNNHRTEPPAPAPVVEHHRTADPSTPR